MSDKEITSISETENKHNDSKRNHSEKNRFSRGNG